MISGNIAEVSRNSIWREHVRKEKREFSPGGTFQMFDPSRVACGEVKPAFARRSLPPIRPATSSINEQKKKDLEYFTTTFRRSTKLVPRNKYQRPVTSSHAVGWETRRLTPVNPRFWSGRRMCPETVYAHCYATMVPGGFGPFDARAHKSD